MRDLWQDISYALRTMRRSPAFSLSIILTLSVGIGATTAVMNLVNATLLKPPAVAAVDALAWVTPVDPNGNLDQWAYPDFVDFRMQARGWSAIAAHGNRTVTLGGASPVRLNGMVVSANFFDMLGVRAALGRAFLPAEDGAEASGIPVVLSHAAWTRRFNGDSGIVGQTIPLNSVGATVVGVMPRDFTGLRLGESVEVWFTVPAAVAMRVERPTVYTWRGSESLRAVGRLAPDMSLDAAQAEAVVVSGRIWGAERRAEDRKRIALSRVRGGLHPAARARIGSVVALLMVVPLLVLGVACANVANLFMSRSVQRQKEIAVRRAIGASRIRLVRQLLTECGILGLASGVVGIGVSYTLTAIIVATAQFPDDVVRLLVPDLTVFIATFAIALAAGALFGLVPALAATRDAITPALKSDGITLQLGRGKHRLRNAFVIGQMSLSLTLLITAGLFVGSLQKALRVEPGFDPANTVSASYELTGQGYDSVRATRFAAELVARAQAEPDVEAAAVANVLPVSGSSSSTRVRRDGEPRGANEEFTYTARVTTGYFTTLRIPVVRGRSFAESDRAESPLVTLVNERLAARLWPGDDPIGKRMLVGDRATALQVVGVARNLKVKSLAEPVAESFYWVPDAQEPIGNYGALVVRARTRPGAAADAARAAFEEVDPVLPIAGLETMESTIARSVDGQRGGAALLGVFGVLGLVLAAFGLFGVIAQGVAARRREIGIRMSLGARAGDVVTGFVREGVVLTLIGAVLGVVFSLAASKLLSSLLFGLAATDGLTFVGATVGLVAVAAVASFVPARRAAKVDPLVALRSD